MNTHKAQASSIQFNVAHSATRPSRYRSVMSASKRSANWCTTRDARSSLTRNLRAINRTILSDRPLPSISPKVNAPANNMTTTPTRAAPPYSGFTPRIGIEITRPVHKMKLRMTAEPSPTVARANPASGPDIPDNVIRRNPSVEPAAFPPGTMLDSARALIWMRNRCTRDIPRPESPSAAFVNGA